MTPELPANSQSGLELDGPAAVLRAAAKLMRERATAASPGPWRAMIRGSEGYLVLRQDGTLRERGRPVGAFGCKDWDTDRADAEYVASMGPHVALPLADLLDLEATIVESISRLRELIPPEPGEGTGLAPLNEAIHAVARAYLGGGQK